MSHSIIDPDIHFIIDADDRSITNETNSRVTIMQYDHNSERVSFDIPRYIEEHDMTLCDLAVVLFTNTGKGTSVSNRSTNSGVYPIKDLAVKKDYPDTLTCSWLISREATQFNGTLKFQLEFICHEDAEAGIPEYNWHTDLCDKIDVKPSLSSSNDIAEVYPDIITEFDKRVDQLETYGVPQDSLNQAISDYFNKNPINVAGGGKLPLEYHADAFTTSKKIAKYELKDQNDDVFIRLEGGNITWYRGVCTKGVEVLSGLYWIDSKHTALTAEKTDYPVNVYTYTEHVYASMVTDAKDPSRFKWTFGEGYSDDDPDLGKFFIDIASDLKKVYYLNNSGDEIGFDISDTNIDIKGLRKISDINFRNDGFTVVMNGGYSMEYTYEIDDNGYVTAIIDGDDHRTNVTFAASVAVSEENS